MNGELKQKIDNIWMQSDFGKWCEAVAKNDMQTAERISRQVLDSGYPRMEVLEDELADKLAGMMKSASDMDEYLRLLEKENSELVEVLIRQELFYMVAKHTKGTVKCGGDTIKGFKK